MNCELPVDLYTALCGNVVQCLRPRLSAVQRHKKKDKCETAVSWKMPTIWWLFCNEVQFYITDISQHHVRKNYTSNIKTSSLQLAVMWEIRPLERLKRQNNRQKSLTCHKIQTDCWSLKAVNQASWAPSDCTSNHLTETVSTQVPLHLLARRIGSQKWLMC